MLPAGVARFLLIGLIAAVSISAQDSLYTLKVDVSSVSLDVAVFNSAGLPVTNLSQQDFQIYEDGRRQELHTFASSDSAYNMLLLVDRSSSMRTQFPFLIQAVNRFMSNLRAVDRISLVAFDDSVRRLVNWRSVRDGSSEKVNLEASGNGTNFYGAMEWAVRDVRKLRGRKAILTFTDGVDNRMLDPGSDAKAFRKVLQTVRQANVPFHFVGIGAKGTDGGSRMSRLAEVSGGHAFFPEKVEEVIPLYDQISRELGISYTLGYTSDKAERDGAYRRIQIVVPGGEYRISQSRTGYSAN